ncbi:MULTISPECIES: hypothetical protein [Rhodococcus]|uniref:hypothetical protein n=1 Tax=Rhodococcus TaxID=1827 RepID=UPI002659674C|nr:hypothetical protein [Rhodococcus ruber]WKK14803.1 hypothetical protein QYN14_27005 [Rhodococcus ruber]
MEPGQSWAYRARRVDDLVEVVVLRLGTQKPPRVLVRFVDDRFEGREEWVPPARLKVPWPEVERLRTHEARWDAIHAAGPDWDDPKIDAAERVLDLVYDDDNAVVGYREGGAIRMKDPARLAAALGVAEHRLTGHRLCFVEDDVTIAPWEVTELVVTTVARLHPEPILEHLAAEERKARYEAIHGRSTGVSGPYQRSFIEPEECVEIDATYYKPEREVLRLWCGPEAGERFDELVELRTEVRRVGEVAQAAIDALRSAGAHEAADRLQRALGQTVEMLRQPETTD